MKLSCFHCNRPISISADQLGTEVACPHCQGVIRLPGAEDYDSGTEEKNTEGLGSWIRNSISGLVSVVVHMALMLIFALVTCDYRMGGGEEGNEVLLGSLPVANLSDSQEEQLDVASAESTAETSDPLDDSLELISPTESASSEFSVEVNLLDFAPGGASGGAAAGISALGGGGGAVGEGASFMGLHAKGSRFCIIADCSGSMEGPKLRYVKEEILETLTTMGTRGRFQLVFFNSGAKPYPKSGWRHPKKEQGDVATWLQSVSAGGGTVPTPAFQVAFALNPRPDAIFFMTDGLFDDAVVAEVAAMNRRGKRVPIHTISFVDASAEPLMRQIANDSGGRYRHVSGF